MNVVLGAHVGMGCMVRGLVLATKGDDVEPECGFKSMITLRRW